MSRLIVIIVALSIFGGFWYLSNTVFLLQGTTEEGVIQVYEPIVPTIKYDSTIEYDVPSTDKAEQVFRLVNRTRLKYGLAPLNYNSGLDISANRKAQDMYERKYFSHTGPNGESFDFFIELEPGLVGENLARGFSVPKAYNAWLASPSHLDNIIEPEFTDIGVGVADDKIVIMFWGPLKK